MKRLLPLAVLLAGSVIAQSALPNVLTIRFLNVGQGDAVLITAPEGQSLLYDGGRSEPRMQELLRQYGVTSLSLVAASHADADHITGLIPAVELFKPKFYLNNGLAATTQTFQKLIRTVAQTGTQGLLAKDQVITLVSIEITVLPPPTGMPGSNQNLNSVGLLIKYGSFRALMTGDSETAETAGWLSKYPASTLGSIDMYKSIHHGAKNGDNLAWLQMVRPTNVVVSVGPNNYGHPTEQALSLYRQIGAKTYRTDQNGTVTVTVQPGGKYTVSTEKGSAAVSKVTAPPINSVPKTAAAQPIPSADTFYQNCAAVRAAGKAPLLRGQPGYRAGLDRDGDGRACE